MQIIDIPPCECAAIKGCMPDGVSLCPTSSDHRMSSMGSSRTRHPYISYPVHCLGHFHYPGVQFFFSFFSVLLAADCCNIQAQIGFRSAARAICALPGHYRRRLLPCILQTQCWDRETVKLNRRCAKEPTTGLCCMATLYFEYVLPSYHTQFI